MTQQTRNDLIAGMDRAAVAEIDQNIMDAYLEPFDCKESYEVRAGLNPEFYAVLSTAEYHQHWESIRSASTGRETRTCPQCCGSAVTRGNCRCETCNGKGWIGPEITAGDTSLTVAEFGASTVTETPTEAESEEYVCPFGCGKPPRLPGAIFCQECHNAREPKVIGRFERVVK